jgi:hypothetical protein
MLDKVSKTKVKSHRMKAKEKRGKFARLKFQVLARAEIIEF